MSSFGGLMKADATIAKGYALRDWNRVAAYAQKHGHADLAEKYAPAQGDGVKRIDRKSNELLKAMGIEQEVTEWVNHNG